MRQQLIEITREIVAHGKQGTIPQTDAIFKVPASHYIDDEADGAFVYFLAGRWSFNYETRKYLAPDAEGEDRSREFGRTQSLEVNRIRPALFVLRGIQGLAFAAGFNAASTLAVEYAPPERRAAALGIFGVSTLATHAISPALGEQLVHRAGFPALFAVAAVFSLVGLVIAWPLRPARPHASAALVRLHPTRGLSAAIATVGCCGVAFGTVLTYVPTFVQDTRLGPVGVFFLTYTGAAVLTRVIAGGLGDVFGRRAVIVPALALLAAGVAAWQTRKTQDLVAWQELLDSPNEVPVIESAGGERTGRREATLRYLITR